MADIIVVLEGAHLLEMGAHDDLMAKGGRYAELYGIQAARVPLIRCVARRL